MRKILKLILKITLGVISKLLLILLFAAIAVVIIWLLSNSGLNPYLH
jgi:hypothetical protein